MKTRRKPSSYKYLTSFSTWSTPYIFSISRKILEFRPYLESKKTLDVGVYFLYGAQFVNTHLDQSAKPEPFSLPKGSRLLGFVV